MAAYLWSGGQGGDVQIQGVQKDAGEKELFNILEPIAVAVIEHNRRTLESKARSDPCMGSIARLLLSLRGELQAVLLTHAVQEQRLRQMAIFEPYLVNEMPTVGLLALMEYRGVAVDVKRMAMLLHSIKTECDRLSSEAQRVSSRGMGFNIASPEQCAELLYDQLKIPPPKKGTKKGTIRSTAEEELKRIQSESDHPQPIVQVSLCLCLCLYLCLCLCEFGNNRAMGAIALYYCSILLASCFMRSAALNSSGVLLPHPLTSLA